LKKSEKQRLQNRAVKKAIKTQIKKVLETAKSGAADQLHKEYNLAAKKLDKAAARRVVHPNLAARKKSQLALLLQRTTNAPPAGQTGQ
jgi:small subunit ribosomal protein S20